LAGETEVLEKKNLPQCDFVIIEELLEWKSSGSGLEN
jgi:hypothetical protein